MFVDFFYCLRDMKIPVTVTEFLHLVEAIDKQLITNIDDLYYIGRSLLVKDEKFFDAWDQAFSFSFKDSQLPEKIREEIFEWLNKPAPFPFEKLDFFEQEGYDWNQLRQMFEERMHEQDDEHEGGNYWIGTKGKSRFGWGGQNPHGIRVGGSSGHGMAVKVAQKRMFQNYRSDRILDTRQIQMALRRLRKLSRIGAPDELNIEESIRQTCKLGGDIELIFQKRKKNNLKLLLLMDVGGSMEPFAALVEQLFSAANKSTHFKDFKYYYFHNCPYAHLYSDIELEIKEPTTEVLRKFDKDYRLVLVGDAAMAPYELTMRYGAIDYFHLNERTGLEWLKLLRNHFSKTVWLNPEVVGAWMPESRKMIQYVFPMYQLSLDGLDQAIDALI
jgi:uncharacterized protein with von Willebrand factor type A (vWA) domain